MIYLVKSHKRREDLPTASLRPGKNKRFVINHLSDVCLHSEQLMCAAPSQVLPACMEVWTRCRLDLLKTETTGAVQSSPELLFVFYITERVLSLRSGGLLEGKLKENFALVRWIKSPYFKSEVLLFGMIFISLCLEKRLCNSLEKPGSCRFIIKPQWIHSHCH